MYTLLFSILFGVVGFILGWLGNERYFTYMMKEQHEFDDLFAENPHPEIYDKDGNINKGDYMFVNFDLGYDPEGFTPEDIIEEG